MNNRNNKIVPAVVAIVVIFIAICFGEIIAEKRYQGRISQLNEKIDHLEKELEQSSEERDKWNEAYSEIEVELQNFKDETVYVNSEDRHYHLYKDCPDLTMTLDREVIYVDYSNCVVNGYKKCTICEMRKQNELNKRDFGSNVTIKKIVEDENTEALRKLEEKYSNDKQ